MSDRILFVSDSLGTPSPHRGIFHYTSGVVKTFNDLGYTTSLLVERPASWGPHLSDRHAGRGALTECARAALISDIVQHFEEDAFAFSWTPPDPALRSFYQNQRAAASLLALIENKKRQDEQITVELAGDSLETYSLSSRAQHLKLFSSLVLSENIYSDSFWRANMQYCPTTVDAEGYDFVYIDTPHFVDIINVSRSRICSVIHDFIPLYDHSIDFEWRRFYLRQIEFTKSISGNIVFNSNDTRDNFVKMFGADGLERSLVVYPSYSIALERASDGADRTRPSAYLETIGQDGSRKQPAWRSELPFFFSILSDEVRKNIADIVKISRRFRGRANFVVAGRIDGEKYTDSRPQDFPNLHFAGYVSETEKFDLLRSCSAFVFPSLLEGFGIPLAEAAMFGAPVICTDTKIFREVTFDKATYWPPHDIDALTSHLEAALRERFSTESNGSALRAQVRSAFSREAMAGSIRTFLEKAT